MVQTCRGGVPACIVTIVPFSAAGVVLPVSLRSARARKSAGAHPGQGHYKAKWITVAVGTTIADRTPHIRTRAFTHTALTEDEVAAIGNSMLDKFHRPSVAHMLQFILGM